MAKSKQDDRNNLDDIVRRCLVFTDRNGKVLDKGSHPFSAWLKMNYKSEEFDISFRVQNSPYSNGSSYIKVIYNGKTVLEAEGCFITNAYDMKAKKYVPGKWEKRFPAIKC